jgi:hypothetical protein
MVFPLQDVKVEPGLSEYPQGRKRRFNEKEMKLPPKDHCEFLHRAAVPFFSEETLTVSLRGGFATKQSNGLSNQIASSGKERPPRNDRPEVP